MYDVVAGFGALRWSRAVLIGVIAANLSQQKEDDGKVVLPDCARLITVERVRYHSTCEV